MIGKTIRIIAGLLISVFFLWLAFRKSDLSQIWVILKGVRVELIVIVFVISCAGLMLRSYRWKTLGKKYDGVPWKSCFEATAIGLMLNTFVPFRGGDLFQAYFLSRKTNLPKSYTLATVFLERIMDLIPPLLMIIGGSFFVVLPEQISLGRLFVFLSVLFLLLGLFLYQRKRFIDVIENFMHQKHSAKIDRFLEHLAQAFVFMKDKQVLTKSIPLTLINWFIISNFSTYLLLNSLGIHINFLAVYLVLGISILSVAIPSSPGYVGTWEFFTMLALQVFHIDKSTALSFAILSHFMALLPTTLIGLYFFYVDIFIKKEHIRYDDSGETET